ncbi:MAG: hypothetical protein SF182_01715 [Deltaproteobacteria bacterium]|nr:hypothetical protein [Deltaproteobacteria bacterium]
MERTEADTTQDGTQDVYVSEPFFKARAAAEGAERVLYCEPSSGQWDLEGERMLAKALLDSADYFLKFGVIDIGHFSMPVPVLRKRARELGYDPDLCRIGNPVDVRLGSNGAVVVKCQLFQGDTPAAEQANILWSNLEAGTRYYPSVGGAKLAKSCTLDKRCTITAAKWTNIGLWQEPVDLAVKAVTPVPIDVFAKALIADGGSDASTLDGGAALRRQSLHGDTAYYRGATAYLRGEPCPHVTGAAPTHDIIKAHFRECCGFDQDAAAAAADRLLWEVASYLSESKRALAA